MYTSIHTNRSVYNVNADSTVLCYTHTDIAVKETGEELLGGEQHLDDIFVNL